MTQKKAQPRDFTESAENLCNPEEVKALLIAYNQAKNELDSLMEELRTQNEELSERIAVKQNEVSAIETDLKGDQKAGIVGAIEKYGSFQDKDAGVYGVRYRRISKSYHPEPLLKHFAKFAELCIMQSVNVPALEGQIRGKLLTEEELKKKGVITEETQYAYYVR